MCLTAQPAKHAGSREFHTVSLVGRIVDDLQGLNHDSEQVFLEIGARLMEFVVAANHISAELKGLTELISGEHGNRVSTVLRCALEQCGHMEVHARERNQTLSALRNGADLMRSTFSGFNDSMSTFRVLCSLTRIETARLGGAGTEFGSLAADVSSLAERMELKVKNVLRSASQLNQWTACTLDNLSKADVLVSGLAPIISAVMGSLKSFSDRQVSVIASSERLAVQSAAASKSIMDAVQSIQFQDITRQQIEHVAEVLKQVSSSESGGSTRPRDAADVLTLQSLQLADADEKFSLAVRKLARDLDDIAGCVRDMVDEGQKLMGDTAGERDSFFAQMEQFLTALLDAVDGYDKSEAATGTAVGELGATLSSMLDATREINAVNHQMVRLALNTNIRAAHIGASGAPLTILSGAVQDLAVTSSQRSEIVAEALGSMNSAATELAARMESGDAEVRTNRQAILVEMRTTAGDLHSWSQLNLGRIKQITALGSRLSDDISTARNGLSIGLTFTDTVTRSRRSLARAAGQMVNRAAGDGAEDSDWGLDDSARQYTMQSEREVHAALSKATSVEVAVLEQPGDLGDNFELF